MQKPMPQTVKVGPHTYSVIRKSAAGMSGNLGHCDGNALIIWVRQRLRKSKAREIFLHEILHACTYASFSCVYSEGENHTGEEFVRAVAPTLLEVLQDNPELVEYLTQ